MEFIGLYAMDAIDGNSLTFSIKDERPCYYLIADVIMEHPICVGLKMESWNNL